MAENSEYTPVQCEPSIERTAPDLGNGDRADSGRDREGTGNVAARGTPHRTVDGERKSSVDLYPVSVVINNLRPGGQAIINLRDDEAATWVSDNPLEKTSRVSVEASIGGTLPLSSFVVNAKALSFDAYDTCEEIRLRLYMHSPGSIVFGSVDLPPAASATIESAVDRTTVIGLSSFALACERVQGER